MNCPWAEQVALLEPLTPELSAHLRSCEPCRELLIELQADQKLIQEPPEVPEGVVAANVLCSLSVRRWRMGLPAAAAAGIVLAIVLPHFTKSPPVAPAASPAVVARVTPPVPPAPPPAASVPPTVHHTTRVRSRPRQANPDELMASLQAMLEPASTATASADTPVLITTQTADPDVVIVLLPERKGDE